MNMNNNISITYRDSKREPERAIVLAESYTSTIHVFDTFRL